MSRTLIADGRTSQVFRVGSDAVIKVLKATVPDAWAEREATLTEAVGELGLPVPAVRGLGTHDGRPGIVLDHIDGLSMWQEMMNAPTRIPQLADELVRLQLEIHAAGLPTTCPAFVSRLESKLTDALDEEELVVALDRVRARPAGAALLHGDLHPGNVLMGRDGPVVIDWFDAGVGHPSVDVARSRLLLRPSGATDLAHLPMADEATVADVARCYDDALRTRAGEPQGAAGWLPLVAAARLAEGTDSNRAELRAIWRSSLVDDDAA